MKRLVLFVITVAAVAAFALAVLVAADAWAAEDVHMVALGDGEDVEGEAGAVKPMLPEIEPGAEEGDPAQSEIAWGEEERNQRLKATEGSLKQSDFSDDDGPSTDTMGPPEGAEYLGVYKLTGYAIWCPDCQGPWVGMSASGAELAPGYSVAMCSAFPFGTRIYIESLGVFEVQDRGGAIGPGRIDVACVDHEQCSDYTGRYEVWILRD